MPEILPRIGLTPSLIPDKGSGAGASADNTIVVEPKASTREAYEQRSTRERDLWVATTTREKILAEMTQTGELLPFEHPLYNTLEGIASRVRPGAKPNFIVSVSDSITAFTLQDKSTIALSYGLFKHFSDYLSTKGKTLTQDHVALVVGHEMSHWDPEAKTIHINERYCDVNGLFTSDAGGFNTDAIVESLEYLEYLDELRKRKEKSEQQHADTIDKEPEIEEDEQGTPINLGKITHSSSENRRILVQLIANDPNLYLNGRLVPTTTFGEELVDFDQRAQNWLDRSRSRYLVSSEKDIETEMASASTTSQVLEAFLGADGFYHARMSQEFAQTVEFGNLVLGLAVYHDLIDQEPGILTKDDFFAQLQAQKIAPSANQPKYISSDDKTIPETFKWIKRDFEKPLPPEGEELIRRILAGEFKNPWQILAADSKVINEHFPQFTSINFNKFFEGLVDGVNGFIRPRSFIVSERPNPYRAQLFGFRGPLNAKRFLAKEDQEVSSQMGQQRGDLLEKVKIALASGLIETSQIDNFRDGPWGARYMESFAAVLKEFVAPLQPLLPDYKKLHSGVTSRLLTTGICQMPEVARFTSAVILESGRYVQKRWEDPRSLSSQAPEPKLNSIRSKKAQEDLRKTLLVTNFALSQGGSELGDAFSTPRIGGIVDRLNSIFYSLTHYQDRVKGGMLDPYQIVIDGGATLSVPHSSDLLDGRNRTRHTRLAFANILFDENFYQRRNSSDKKLVCKAEDEQTVRKLVLDTVPISEGWDHNRITVMGAVLGNRNIRMNVGMLRRILREGIEKGRLTQNEVKRILNSAGQEGEE